jgi:hypothetical protein
MRSLAYCRVVQPVTPTWAKTYGGDEWDRGACVKQANDGGYIIVGNTKSFGHGNDDIYLLKIDSDGQKEWSKVYGGPSIDESRSVCQTSDGGYIIAGYSKSFSGGPRDAIYIIKTDSLGKIEWSRPNAGDPSDVYGSSEYDKAYSILENQDKDYIVAGTTNYETAGNFDFYLVKIGIDKERKWSHKYGGTGQEMAFSLQETSDGGYVMAGFTQSFGKGGDDFYVVKTDKDGVAEWQKPYGTTQDELARAVQEASDNGYIIVGRTKGALAGRADIYLVKTDSQGNEEWSKTFGRASSDDAYSIAKTKGGGYIIVGYTSVGWVEDLYLIKIDSTGAIQWEKTHGVEEEEIGIFVRQCSDEGYIISGQTESFGQGTKDVYILKTDSSGNCPEPDSPDEILDNPELE